MKHQYYQDLPIYSSQNSLDETSILPGSTVAIYSSQNSLDETSILPGSTYIFLTEFTR